MDLTKKRISLGFLLGIFTILLTFMFAPVPQAKASVDDFEFSSLEVDYYLGLNSDSSKSQVLVVEHWVAVFPEYDQNRGIIRSISEFDGFYPMNVQVHSIVNERGQSIYYYTESEEDELRLIIDDDTYKHGETHYIISYTMDNIVRDFEDGSEFYPNINPPETPQPIKKMSTRIHFAEAIAGGLDGRVACWAGVAGGNDGSRCTFSGPVTDNSSWPSEAPTKGDSASVITSEVSAGINSYEVFSVDVGFAPGTFPERTLPSQFWAGIWSAIVAAGLSVLQLIRSILDRLKYNSRMPKPVIAQYLPPKEGIVAASVVSGRWFSSFPAHVIDLVVNKQIKVVSKSGKEFTSGNEKAKSTDFAIMPAEAATRNSDDVTVLQAVFGPKFTSESKVNLGSPDDARAKRISKMRSDFIKGVKASDLYMDKPKNGRWGLWIFLLTVVAIFGLFYFNTVAPLPGWLTAVVLLIAGSTNISAMIASSPSRQLSDSGMVLKWHILGIRDYIKLAEADRFRMLQSPTTADRKQERTTGYNPWTEAGQALASPDPQYVLNIYEKLLPYAVLFGIEDEWQKVLEELNAQIPEQSSSTGYALSGIPMHNLTRGIQASGMSVSSSSGGGGSSGFSGGGSSGGGFSGGSVGGR